MANFHETAKFPDRIAYGSKGGPRRKTNVVELGSGFEHRNAVWAESKRQYDVSYGIKSLNDLNEVLEFWEARLGPLFGFRFKDHADFKSVRPQNATTALDQQIGVGDGVETEFQLVKIYQSFGNFYTRKITKPVAGTVKVSVNNVEIFSPADFTVDTTTGIVTLTSPAPNGQLVKAGFEFDVPVRFIEDMIDISLDSFELGSIGPITLVEVKI